MAEIGAIVATTAAGLACLVAASAPAASAQTSQPRALGRGPVLIYMAPDNKAHIISDGVEIGVADGLKLTPGAKPGDVGRPVSPDVIPTLPPWILPYVVPQRDWAKYKIDPKAASRLSKSGVVVEGAR